MPMCRDPGKTGMLKKVRSRERGSLAQEKSFLFQEADFGSKSASKTIGQVEMRNEQMCVSTRRFVKWKPM